MSRARIILPGVIRMVQRRTVWRLFLLKPTRKTVEILRYALALCVRRCGVQLHEFVTMSNHFHFVVTDKYGRLPKFMERFDSLVARALNQSYGRFGTFWENEQYSGPILPSDDDVLNHCVYTLVNPCKAGLVAHASDWEGLTSIGLNYGDTLTAKRPAGFFSEDMPEEVSCKLVRPPIYLHLSDAALRAEVRRRVADREYQYRDERRQQGRYVLGMNRVLRQGILDSPTSREKRFGIRPQVSSRSTFLRLEFIGRFKQWYAKYHKALRRYLAGFRDAIFPAGTYLMRVRHGVACASP